MEPIIAIYLYQRKIGGCVSLQDITVIAASIGQPDTHAALTIHNVLIGHDQPVHTDNESRGAAAAGSDLDHTRLNTFDELRERRSTLAG